MFELQNILLIVAVIHKNYFLKKQDSDLRFTVPYGLIYGPNISGIPIPMLIFFYPNRFSILSTPPPPFQKHNN